MSLSHDQVIRNYFNSYDRDHYNKGANVFFEGNTLYSYGRHFKLCVKGQNGYIINADKYSSSTSTHTSNTIRHAPKETPQIPFSALESARINPENIYVLEKTSDTWELWDHDKKIIREEGNILMVDILDPYEWKNEDPEHRTIKHHLGACLFKHQDRYYLSGLDEGNYFLVELPSWCDRVKDAYYILSGLSEYHFDNYQQGYIKRQGEFFFHPTGETGKPSIFADQKKAIPEEIIFKKGFDIQKFFDPLSNGNSHKVRDSLILCNGSYDLYVRGSIRHPQHKMLSLGEQWHKVTKNSAVNSWSASGNVD